MKHALLLVIAISACKYAALPPLTAGDAGGDGSLPPGSPMLAAVEPAIAPAGATITLEGAFSDPMTVNFPGGVTATATVLGPHRATAIVPATATSGSLNVTTGGVDTAAVPFRTTPFTPKIANFRATFDQVDAARPAPVLGTARAGAAAAVAGHFLYVIGGEAGGTYLDTVESALIDADGTLGAFTTVSAVTLATARSGAVSDVIGGYVYVIGGTGTGGPVASVERAPIQADGTLGAFAPVSGVVLATARTDAASAIIGDAICVFGGTGASGTLASIECAVIDPDGGLEPFTAVSQVLSTARAGAAAITAGGYVYVLGGATASGIKNSVESAAIAPDGTLGTFAATTGVALASARAYFSTAVLGTTLYVVGGTSAGGGDLATIEAASIATDGTLNSFALVAGVQTAVAHHAAATAFARDHVIMLGGSTGAGELASVERASIDNDGSLGAFATLSTLTLSGPRAEGMSVTIGDYVYQIGGADLTTLTVRTDVDAATVQADGTLGTFALASGVALTGPRDGSLLAVIGGYLYVIGGTASGTDEGLATIERAPIQADGTLGTFATYANSQLVVGRAFATAAIIGSNFYVFGGIGNGLAGLITVEQATIDSTGTLGTFSAITNRLNYGHANATTVVLDNYCYVIGGGDSGGTTNPVFERAPILNGALGTIDYELDTNGNQMYLSVPRALHTSAVIGDHLYLIAGASNVGSPADPGLRSVDHTTIDTDGSLGGFGILASATLSEGIFYHTGAKAGNYVYVLGGGSHTSVTTPSEVKQALLP